MAESSSSESPRSGSDNEVEPTDPTTHVLPGPYRWDVLRRRRQRTHISQLVWNDETYRLLKIRRGGRPTAGPPPDDIPDVVAQYLTEAGFIHVARMQYMPIDAALISAMVERWRPETHTFHMPQGEMTITLEDVAGILGLPTDGQVVTGQTYADWPELCNQVFGKEYGIQQTYFQPPRPEQQTQSDTYWPPWETQTPTATQACYETQAGTSFHHSPVQMPQPEWEHGGSSSQGGNAWDDADVDALYTNIHFSLPDEAGQDSGLPHEAFPSTTAEAEAPAAHTPTPQYQRGRGRRRLPDRQARHNQWPPPSA